MVHFHSCYSANTYTCVARSFVKDLRSGSREVDDHGFNGSSKGFDVKSSVVFDGAHPFLLLRKYVYVRGAVISAVLSRSPVRSDFVFS